MAKAICNFEMTYNGVTRYKGEVFLLGGFMNDDKLVRVGHVRPVTGDMEPLKTVKDDTGREFISEEHRVAYRMAAAEEGRILVRRPGRPSGSRTRKPKAATGAA